MGCTGFVTVGRRAAVAVNIVLGVASGYLAVEVSTVILSNGRDADSRGALDVDTVANHRGHDDAVPGAGDIDSVVTSLGNIESVSGVVCQSERRTAVAVYAHRIRVGECVRRRQLRHHGRIDDQIQRAAAASALKAAAARRVHARDGSGSG